MVLKSDKIRLRKMLSDSITVLCRAGLPFQSKVQVEALIGITLDDSEVILLSFKETMSSNGLILSSDSADEDDTNDRHNFVIDEDQNCNSASVTVKAEYANVEWDATDNYKTTNRSRQKFRDFDASGEGVKGNFSGEQDELFPSTSTEMGRQPGDDGYDRFDGSLVNDNQLGRNFSDEGHRGFRAQMKVEVNDELDNNTDDCMITKSEVLTSGECYEIDEDQTWAGQDDVFDGNNFHDLQGGEVPCDTMPTAYDQDPNWLPQLSKPPPAKKFKMPLQQKRQTWTARPSSTFTKSRNFQPAAKLHSKPTPRPIKNEVTSSWKDEDWSVEGQQLTCKYCGLQLNTVQTLREHVKGVHLNLSSYSCEFCHQTFKWRMALSRHRRNFHKLFMKSNVKFEN